MRELVAKKVPAFHAEVRYQENVKSILFLFLTSSQDTSCPSLQMHLMLGHRRRNIEADCTWKGRP